MSEEKKISQQPLRQPESTPESGTSGTKDNSECASLRVDSLPPSEKVREVVPQPEGTAVAAAKRQNMMDDGQLAQIPAGKNFPTTTGSDN
jgi:hypothetical protein